MFQENSYYRAVFNITFIDNINNITFADAASVLRKEKRCTKFAQVKCPEIFACSVSQVDSHSARHFYLSVPLSVSPVPILNIRARHFLGPSPLPAQCSTAQLMYPKLMWQTKSTVKLG